MQEEALHVYNFVWECGCLCVCVREKEKEGSGKEGKGKLIPAKSKSSAE